MKKENDKEMNIVLMKIRRINERLSVSTNTRYYSLGENSNSFSQPQVKTVAASPRNKKYSHELSIKLPVCNLNSNDDINAISATSSKNKFDRLQGRK